MKGLTRLRGMGGNGRAGVQALAVAAILLLGCGPAQAFYWHNWPGSGVVAQQSLIPRTHRDSPANPPTTPRPVEVQPEPGSPHIPPPPIGPPVPVDHPPVGPPSPTPEPATGLLGLLGLGALAVRRWRRPH